MVRRFAILAIALSVLAPPAWASFDIGWYAYTAGDYETARLEWVPLAEDGDIRAQFQLGVMFEKGKGVEPDAVEAVRWYRMAADQGHAPAQTSLATFYYSNKGVKHDHAEAVRWYQKAADQGNADAQYLLGALYFRGHGIARDVIKAHMWFSLAAMRCSRTARERRDRNELSMTAAQIEEAKRLAQAWLDSH